MVAGREGYAQAISHQTEIGNVLRQQLTDHGWRVVNRTPLPTVCWTDGEGTDNSLERLVAICDRVVTSGEAWISTTKLGGQLPVLRATITNYRTEETDIRRLMETLERAR